MEFGPLIPGQTPIDDISGLRDRTIRTQSELNAAEAENIRQAALKYLAAKPSRRLVRFDLPWAKKLHADMFGKVWAWAGSFRNSELNIGSAPVQIEQDLAVLLDDLRSWADFDMPMLEQSVRLHHGAVRIHPFKNGNGRWSRMLGNIWLRFHGAGVINWPEETIGTECEIRMEYIRSVQQADLGEFESLIRLHERFAD
ncbi:MAG: Fic-DOC domain mobile mystery protein B [Phycisphaerales bacterium]|jgi:Fic-DOC domain mobile mystery protein B